MYIFLFHLVDAPKNSQVVQTAFFPQSTIMKETCKAGDGAPNCDKVLWLSVKNFWTTSVLYLHNSLQTENKDLKMSDMTAMSQSLWLQVRLTGESLLTVI